MGSRIQNGKTSLKMERKYRMKLRDYIIVGYILSFLITIMAVFWASNLMLIEKKDTYFIVVITIIAGLIGATISIILLKGVFKSLHVLKRQMISISEKNFDFSNTVEGPTEFRELSLSFNEMAKNLKESFDSLEESEKEKSLMIAQLSHDIKTPITSIQSTAEGMLDGIIKEEEYKYYLETICRQTTRLNKLVEELNYLTLSVKDTSEDDKNETIFLDKLLIDCMSEFKLRAEKEKRDIYIKVIPENAKIVSNYNKIQRIIVNLIGNAFKYSPSGTKIEIVAEIKNQELSVSIIDEGCGIKEEEIDNIFKRLYRVEASRNMKTGGYGLGLAIAKQLALQINGDILVESEYGKGSKFTLKINC